nr:hypothetical protein [Pseudomonas typographi]
MALETLALRFEHSAGTYPNTFINVLPIHKGWHNTRRRYFKAMLCKSAAFAIAPFGFHQHADHLKACIGQALHYSHKACARPGTPDKNQFLSYAYRFQLRGQFWRCLVAVRV